MARGDMRTTDISDTGFFCEPASNGGWVVWDAPSDNMHRRTMIAAYSTPTEMIAGLSTLLSPPAPAGDEGTLHGTAFGEGAVQ